MNIKKQIYGFTLIELMIVLFILGIMVVWATHSYQRQAKQAKLMAAKSALIENANYLTNYYSKYSRYNTKTESDNCAWPVLLKAQVAGFKIAFNSDKPGSCQTESYILIAEPDDSYKKMENRYLRMDEHQNVTLCSNQQSSQGEDDNCVLYK